MPPSVALCLFPLQPTAFLCNVQIGMGNASCLILANKAPSLLFLFSMVAGCSSVSSVHQCWLWFVMKVQILFHILISHS